MVPAFAGIRRRNPEPGNAFSRSLSNEGHLNRNYTFETFVKGDSNQFAVATCLSAAENPEKPTTLCLSTVRLV